MKRNELLDTIASEILNMRNGLVVANNDSEDFTEIHIASLLRGMIKAAGYDYEEDAPVTKLHELDTIVVEVLRIETGLYQANNDSDDFNELHVTDIRNALEAAYALR